MIRALYISAFIAVAVTSLSCKVNPYCLNCDTGDGGTDGNNDGGSDGSGSDAGSCVPTNNGTEICDGIDNDCDGKIDEDVAQVGQQCANQMGECAGGTVTCTMGKLGCTKSPSPEICDNKDNDCDGAVDNNNPLVDSMGMSHPSKCGNGVGECHQGDNKCQAGVINCVGAIGPTPEVCDGKDNDCDGVIDNGLTNLGSCGSPPLDCGGMPCAPCALGTLSCIGGAPQCIGEVDPTVELCNGKDDDCDGVIDNGFNLNSDPQNCGTCGTVCAFPNAVADCVAKNCGIQICEPGFFDVNKVLSDGCEYACTLTGTEVCDGKDNDCNGKIDDGLTPPAICATKGACAGTTATCDGPNGFRCHYPSPPAQLDGNGNLVTQETLCDGIDNDCDGIIDEGTPNLGQPCFSGTCKLTGGDCFLQTDCTGGAGDTCLFQGRCGGKGVFVCDTDPAKPAKCLVQTHGQKPIPETCDNLDNDCDGVVDNGGSTGSLVGQDWVEHRRQHADDEVGGVEARRERHDRRQRHDRYGVQQAGRAAVDEHHVPAGGRGVHRGRRAPVRRAGVAPHVLGGDADDVAAHAAGDRHVHAGRRGGGLHDARQRHRHRRRGPRVGRGLRAGLLRHLRHAVATPDTGDDLDNTNVIAQAPHLDFTFKVPEAGTYNVWVLEYATNTASGATGNNRTWVDMDLASMGGTVDTSFRASLGTVDAWTWISETHNFTLAANSTHTVNIFMGRDGVRIDAIAITNGGSGAGNKPALPTNPAGHHWAYSPASAADTYNPATCNGHDFSAADDNVLPTGSEASCFATTGAGVFDMSGNVKEWTLAHRPGEDPIRGGASNNDDQGISCPLNFTLADDTFFFPNVGFRCCR